MTTTAHDCDVLIVGAGPTGSVLALMLAQRHVRVLVADREADIYALPRAAHIDHEAMRIFQAIGLAEPIAASSRLSPRYDFLNKYGDVLLRFDGSDAIGPGGWPAANMIHQPSIERALRNAIIAAPEVDVRTSWSLTGLADQQDGIVASFATGGGARSVAARFIVGADGARSPVRELSGIGIDDLNFDEPWLVIDTIVHDPSQLPTINLQICDPARPTTCVLMGSGRHRWEFMLKDGETPEQVTHDAFVADLLNPGTSKARLRSSARRCIGSTPRSRRNGIVAVPCSPATQRTSCRPLPVRACVRGCGTPPMWAGSWSRSWPTARRPSICSPRTNPNASRTSAPSSALR